MTLSTAVDLAQLVGNLAVVVTVLLAIRQLATASLTSKTSSADALVHNLNGFYMTLAANSELAHIYRRGRAQPTSLNEQEHARFFFVCVAWFAYHEHLYVQWKERLLPDKFYGPWELALKEDLKDPGFRQFWELERQNFDTSFQEHITKLIGQLPTPAAP